MSIILFFFLISGWELQTSGVNVNLFDIDCVSSTECWAVGDSGTILHTTDGGVNWVLQSSGTTEDLRGIDFLDSLNGWVVGYGPIHLHTTDGGVSWTEVISGSSYELFNVAFANSNRGWVTGRNGTIIGTFDGGNTWSSELAGEWAWIYGITVVSSTRAWVIGADWFMGIAPIFKYNGTIWSKQYDITDTKTGREISAADSLNVWAVGGDGVIFYTADGGANWTSQTSGTTEQFEGVSATSTSSCWAAGSEGIILHTSDGGGLWSQQESPVSDTLFDVVMWDNFNGWAVGGNGVVLHTTDGGAGIEETIGFSSTSSLNIFPDPVRSELHLSLPNLSKETINIYLYDVNGRFISHLYAGYPEKEFDFSLSQLPAGVYFLVISSAMNKLSHRFVKIH